jgi:hypothetical protein
VRNFESWGSFAVNKFEWFGQYRIDGDFLCEDFQQVGVGGEGCRPVYRNTDAASGGNKEYVIVGALGFYGFSPAD